jgi:1L-myo-inositol 1-phosphate cytidylyltransferase / CDP-L-myo-inositol myo-inositolphosphotransferase
MNAAAGAGATLVLASSGRAPEAGISPGTRVLGLPLLRRAALAASRAGYDRVYLLGETPDSEVSLAGTSARPVSRIDITDASLPAGRVVLLPDCAVATTKWLRDLRETPLEPDRLHRLGEGAIVESSDPAPLLRAASAGDLEAVVSAWSGLLPPGDPASVTPPFAPATRAEIPAAEALLLRDLVKAGDGPLTRLFSRRVSLAVTRRLARTALRPNAMTVLCVALGLAAAWCLASPEPARQALGGIVFLLHSILDGCDGELARLKFQESRLGGLLDFWGDNIVHVAVFSAFAIAWSDAIDEDWPLTLGGLAVGGTLLSAGFIYVFAMRPRGDAGPLLTTVSPSRRSRLTQVLDGTGNRDFIYLVAVLGIFGRAYWFLAPAAVGTPTFFLGLLIMARGGPRGEGEPTPVLEGGTAASGDPSR